MLTTNINANYAGSVTTYSNALIARITVRLALLLGWPGFLVTKSNVACATKLSDRHIQLPQGGMDLVLLYHSDDNFASQYRPPWRSQRNFEEPFERCNRLGACMPSHLGAGIECLRRFTSTGCSVNANTYAYWLSFRGPIGLR